MITKHQTDDDAILQDGEIPLPPSPLYELRSTITSGRAVFATTTIPKDTLILRTSTKTKDLTSAQWPDTSPLAWVIQRPYRKECCAECFAYDRGREWKLKVPRRDCGVVFCSPPCLEAWSTRNGEVGIQAWENLEAGVKAILKRRVNEDDDEATQDSNNEHVDGTAHTNGVAASTKEDSQDLSNTGPSDSEIEEAWTSTALISEVIQHTRTKTHPSKIERKVLRNAIEQGGDPDLMYFVLTAIIQAHNTATQLSPLINPNTTTTQDQPTSTPTQTPVPPPTTLLHPLFHLTPTNTAYVLTHTSLSLLTTTHTHLLTLLPPPLLQHLTPILSHNLNTRAAHNAFSIRPTNNTDGPDSGEFLGHAIYPSASFFNHSCAPNLRKERVGRVWSFYADREIECGEELGITYLGGEEGSLEVEARRRRLRGEWGFVCCCGRCLVESGEGREGRK